MKSRLNDRTEPEYFDIKMLWLKICKRLFIRCLRINIKRGTYKLENKLEEILTIINEALNSPQGRSIRNVAPDVIALSDPVAAVVVKGINSFIDEFDNYKLNNLLLGLSSNLDTEKKLNELYNYVKSNPDRAFKVGNIFKQNINSATPVVGVLYGHIISNHIGENEHDFSQNELIVCNALSTATDFDIKNFKVLMDKCVKVGPEENRFIGYPLDDNDIQKDILNLETTCSWCAYNRIFQYSPMRWSSFDKNEKVQVSNYVVLNPADILYEYVKGIGRVVKYGE